MRIFFINNEIIVTEKSGKIKIVDILTNQIQEVDHQLEFWFITEIIV